MRRINKRTVELLEIEQTMRDAYDALLDKGYPIPFSAKVTLNRFADQTNFLASEEFIEYLSDGTCVRDEATGRVVVKPEWKGRKH